MVSVENVSPTGAATTIKFMVMVTAAINSGSLWRDFPKTITPAIIQNCCLRTWNRRFDDGNRYAARSTNTCRRAICDFGNATSRNRWRAQVGSGGGSGKARRGFYETTAPLRTPATATAAAVDSLSGARKCNVTNNTCPRRPYAPREKSHEETTAALTAANASMECSRPYAAVRELEAV
jgi:hypothetical protein